MNLRSLSGQLRSSRVSVTESLAGQQMFTTVANYRGGTVAVQKVRKSKVKLEREVLQEMRGVRKRFWHTCKCTVIIHAQIDAFFFCLYYVWKNNIRLLVY